MPTDADSVPLLRSAYLWRAATTSHRTRARVPTKRGVTFYAGSLGQPRYVLQHQNQNIRAELKF